MKKIVSEIHVRVVPDVDEKALRDITAQVEKSRRMVVDVIANTAPLDSQLRKIHNLYRRMRVDVDIVGKLRQLRIEELLDAAAVARVQQIVRSVPLLTAPPQYGALPMEVPRRLALPSPPAMETVSARISALDDVLRSFAAKVESVVRTVTAAAPLRLPAPPAPPRLALPHLAVGGSVPVDAVAGALNEALRSAAMGITVPPELYNAMYRLVEAHKLTAEQAVEAVQTGFSKHAAIVRSIARDAEASGTRMMTFGQSLRKVNQIISGEKIALPEIRALKGLSEPARALSVSAALYRSSIAEVSSALRSGAAEGRKSIREISATLRSLLEAEGLKAPSVVIRASANAIRNGVMTIDEALKAMRAGLTQSSETLKGLGVNAKNASRAMNEVSKSLAAMAAPPPGGGIAPPPPPTGFPGLAGPTGAPEPSKVIAAASAFHAASRSAQGFMKSLMTLRWQIFTILFFIGLLSSQVSRAADAFYRSARRIDSLRLGFALIRAAGVSDVGRLVTAIQDASGATMSLAEVTSVLSRSIIRGVDTAVLEATPALMRYAQVLSVVTGGAETSEQIFTKMMEAIQRGQVRLAVTTGALSGTMTNLLDLFKEVGEASAGTATESGRLAQELLKTGIMAARGADALTPYQRSLLVAWQILRMAETALSGVGDEFDATTRKVGTLRLAFEESFKAISAAFTRVLAPVAEFLGKLIFALEGVWLAWARGPVGALRAMEGYVEQVAAMQERVTPKGIFEYFAEYGRQALLALQAQEDGTENASEKTSEMIEKIRELLGVLDAAGSQAEETGSQMADAFRAGIRALQAYLEYLVDIQREEEDVARQRARDLEDLERDLAQRREDIERDAARRREEAQRQYRDRTQEAERDLARRLEQINRDLARRLNDIWRDYNDKLYDAIAERDAIAAIAAMRERDRRIQEAHEWADDARRTAYERYQDAIEDEKEALEKRLRAIQENRQRELEDLNRWLARRREELAIAWAREAEDRAIANRRRLEDIIRQYQIELIQQRIANDAKLTEEQRYFQLALALRQYYESILSRPIIIPIAIQQPSLPSTRPPSSGRGGAYPRMAGGVDIVTRPTAFIAHPGEMVTTVPVFRRSPLPVSVNGTIRHSVSAMVESQIRGIEGRVAAAVTQALISLFRSMR